MGNGLFACRGPVTVVGGLLLLLLWGVGGAALPWVRFWSLVVRLLLDMTEEVAKMSGMANEAFWSRVRMTHTCWNWVGFVNPRGYGQFTPDVDAGALAHRIAYKLMGGELIDGLVLDHLCENRRCVNPQHLDQVTQGENVRRAAAKGRYAKWDGAENVCLRGHEYTPENTYTTARGKRFCRKCNVHRNRTYRQRRAGVSV